jgi:hypothetical protein
MLQKECLLDLIKSHSHNDRSEIPQKREFYISKYVYNLL